MSNPTSPMENSTNEDFASITWNEIETDWSILVKQWVSVALLYLEITDKLSDVMTDNFPTPSAFRYNHAVI